MDFGDETDHSSNARLLSPAEAIDRDRSLDLGRGYSGGWFVWVLTVSAGISGLLFGYDTGVISATLVSIDTDLSNRPLTTLDKSLITSCTSLFALIASPVAGALADRFGRRMVILAADVLFAVGALWQAVTGAVWGMIGGRCIVGLAIGSASLVTPLYVGAVSHPRDLADRVGRYISELAPSHIRGRLVTVLCLLITGGQVIAYVVGWLFSSVPGGWRWLVGLGAVPGVFQLAIFVVLPETPRWLVQMGFESDAQGALAKIYQGSSERDHIVKKVFRDIQQEVSEEEEALGSNKAAGNSWMRNVSEQALDLFRVGGNRRALIIAMMLQGLQQLCGFNSLMYFSATIFSALSFSSPTLTSLSVAMTNFIFTLFAFVLIDRIGRRYILLYSIPVMILSLVACAFAFSALGELPSTPSESQGRAEPDAPAANDSPIPIIILLSLTVYTAAYAFGLGNVPWQQSELFPLRVRSLGSGLATATNWGSNFIVGLTFLPMLELLSPGLAFTLYAIVCAAGWVGVWVIYPEMSGLNLEEVKGLLEHGWGVQKSLRRVRRRTEPT
ncbi:myo-inositol transporter [Aspergillus sp. HF37]|nr:myo-inositol transporter [Aspergillus sp. HF37]